MLINRNQSTIIYYLNQYLDRLNLPVRVDKRGICNALSSIHAKYVLEKREDEFYRILDKISTMSLDPKLEDEINHFTVEIVLSMFPQMFNKKENQYKSIEALQIQGRNLKSSFQFGLIAKNEDWCNIIKDLKLREDEVILLRIYNHAISIHKKNGNYRIFDPNYVSGFKDFADEEKLIKEINRISKTKDTLGMSIQVIKHPNATPREFPKPGELYEKYLDPSLSLTIKERKLNNMYFIITLNDKEGLDQFFAKGGKDDNPLESIGLVVSCNNIEILTKLLERAPKDMKKLELAFETALDSGYQEAFNELLKNDQCNVCFKQHVMHEKNAANFIASAAGGGNVDLLKQLLDCYKNNGNPNLSNKQIAEQILKSSSEHGNAVQKAISSGNTSSVKLLLEELKTGDNPSGEKQLLTYLAQAIKTNQPHMVNLLVDVIKTSIPEDSQKNIFQAIQLSTIAVGRTDLSILRTLQSCGVPFSATAKALINCMANKPIGILLYWGITITLYTDYFKELCGIKNGVMDNIEQFKELKKNIKEMKTETDKPDAPDAPGEVSSISISPRHDTFMD